MKRMITLASVCLMMVGASSVSAQTVYDLPSKAAPVMVHDGSGVVFLGKDASVYRVFSWNASKKADFDLLMTDIDGDGKPNVVGAGKPTFVLNHDADPMWYLDKGCDQVIVQDFAADNKQDLMCLNGNDLTIYTHDGQLIWKARMNTRLGACKAADINGDLKADIECQIGKNKFTRFDGAQGQVLAESTDTSEIEETVYAKTTPVESTEEGTLLKKDLDGDGTEETISVSKKEIVVSGKEGEPKKFSTNTRKYKRVPVADLKSVMANGFEDNEAAQKVVTDLNDKLANCYASQVRKNQFAGQGDVLLEVKVGAKSKVEDVSLLHSGLADQGVAKCAIGVLKKGKYPASEAGGKLNIRMFYTFADK